MSFTKENWLRSRSIILSLIIFFSLIKYADSNTDSTIDSLIRVVKSSENDTNKVLLLIKLAELNSTLSSAEAIEFSKSCLALSNQLNYNRGKLFGYEKLGTIYKNIGEFDSALIYTEKAINQAELVGDKKLHAKTLNIYGSLLRRKGYYSAALEYHQKSLEKNREMNDKQGMANSYIFIAIVNDHQLNYDTAIFYYYQCMRIYEELNDKLGIGVTCLNIGDLFLKLGDYNTAKKNYFKGLSLFREIGDIRNIGLSNNKIGVIYSETGQMDSALFHYLICEKYCDSINNKSGLAHLNICVGNLYLNWEKYDSAFNYYSEAKSAFQQMDFKVGYLTASIGLANVYTNKGQINKALDIYDTCQKIAAEVSPRTLLNIYENVLSIYKNSGNYKKAFEYQSKYYEIQDSIFNLENTNVITDLTLKYEKEKDQAKILILENKNLQQNLALRKKTNQNLIILFISLGLILLAVFTLVYYRQKTIKDKIIADQRINQLEEDKKLLAARSIVNGQEEERKRIANELHDGLGVLLSATKMQFTAIKDKSPENMILIDKATKLLDQATGDVRRISHNMMPGLLTKFGFFEAVEDLFEQINDTKELKTEVLIEGKTTRLPDNMEIMLYRIVQEMLNNTLKYANAQNVLLNIKVMPEQLNLQFSDDGKGFDVQKMLDTKTIGLTSILSRVKFLNGVVRVESKPGNGCVYFIQIPQTHTL